MFKEENLTQNNSAKNNNLEVLKQNFSHCFDKNWDFDFDKFKNEISKNEIDFSKESYWMDWLGKSYARVLASEPARTLLKEDKDWNKKEENKNSENVLIKWDNLEVLKHLSNAYHEKVKMIYIDPPYNTGSDGFVYQDDRKFDVKEFSKLAWVDAEKSKRILEFVDSKSNSHSAWLTFMYPRLYIAKRLLKDDGAIFVSIDDNEVSQLKILMDEIFGEENFVAEIPRISSNQRSWQEQYMNVSHDYVLVYTTSKDFNNIIKRDISSETKIRKDNIWIYIEWDTKAILAAVSQWYSKWWDYDFEFNWKIYKPITKDGTRNRWLWTEDRMKKAAELWILVETKNTLRMQIYLDKKFEEWTNKMIDKDECLIFHTADFMLEKTYSNTRWTSELSYLFDWKKIFSNPKPIQLIYDLINLSSNENDIILDFFAWSWTTWDAVMQLNSEDWGNRKFILAQIPELIDKEKSKIAYDFVKNELWIETPTIFEITKERLIRAGKKIKEDKKDDEKIKNIDFWFKVFETTPIWEDYNVESEEFSESLTLFDETKLNEEDIQTLLTTWKTADNIKLTQDLEEIDLDWYIAHYFEDKIYLMNKGFETKNLKALLEKIDTDKTFEPKSIIAFGYHFESKNLREIAENIKAYSNKKNIDIDFITRY